MTNLASDFAGFYWFQLAVPAVTWGSLAGCVAGPLYAPAAWLAWVQIVMFIYIALASGHTWRLYCALRETHGVIAARKKRAEAGGGHQAHQDAVAERESPRGGEDLEALRPLFSSKTFYHVFIIPNYHEPVELLQATLDMLSRHKNAARRYIVVLAMEAHEEGHKPKAALLIEQYRASFLHMLDTAHVKTDGEFGVAANSNFAMREAAHRLTGMGYTLEEVIVTKIDADAEVPELYIDVLDQALQAADAPHLTVFTIPVLFERNADQVPDLTRVMDFNWGALCWQQMQNTDGLGWPVSNYSVSLKLLRDMDFLDTNQLAIAEDSHLFLKAFYKTQGRVRSHCVHVPFNMVCVQTEEDTWKSNAIARFVQAERHFQGVNEMAYVLKQTLKSGCVSWAHVRVLHRAFENTVFPGLIPTYFFLACAFMGPLLFLTAPDGGSHELWTSLFRTAVFGNLLAVNQILMYLIFKSLRDLCRKELYGLPVTAMRAVDLLRDVFWMAVAAFVVMYIPHFVAVTRAVLPCVQKRYVRGDKAVSSSAAPSPARDKAEENIQ